MTLSLRMVTFDTTDADSLAEWWAEQTGGEVVERNDGWYVIVAGGSLPVHLAFQKVEDPTPGKNRLHLDLEAGAGERQAEVDRLVGLGASVSARHDEGEGFGWVTLADPQGNLFDIAGASADGS